MKNRKGLLDVYRKIMLLETRKWIMKTEDYKGSKVWSGICKFRSAGSLSIIINQAILIILDKTNAR